MPKRKQNRQKISIEDIYRNQHFVPPKEQNLETIFEEPRHSKDGATILTSVKKYKRYLHFDPTQNKIQKRKKKAKQCFKKLKTNYVTRSSPENSKTMHSDVSLCILDVLDDSDTDMDASNACNSKSDESQTREPDSESLAKEAPFSNPCSTPKRTPQKPKSSKLQLQVEDEVNSSSADQQLISAEIEDAFSDSQRAKTTDDKEENLDSPRRSCCIS